MSARFRIAYVFLFTLTLASFASEFVSNDRPLLLKYRGELLSPALRHYPPAHFGIEDRVKMSYKDLPLGPDDWAVWPPNRWGPFERNDAAGLYPSAPDARNWLGTDDRGRDVLARLLYGYRNSLGFAVLTFALCTLIAVMVGATTGYFGGRVDFIGQRLVELVTSVPQMFVLVYLITLVTPSLGMLVLVTGLLSWTYLSTFVRAEVLRQRQMLFVEAARANGAGLWRTLGAARAAEFARTARDPRAVRDRREHLGARGARLLGLRFAAARGQLGANSWRKAFSTSIRPGGSRCTRLWR